jgi:hypothetical protein
MVNAVLALPKNAELQKDDCTRIDSFIDNIIAKHSTNSEMMNLMALEASSLSTSVESRSKDLESQGWLTRTFRELTGNNQKVSARNQRDLAKSQYLGQQMLNKLADNNLMTYQMVVAVGDKLNRVVADANDTKLEVAKLNQTLSTFFSSIRQKLEKKFTSLERNDDLLFWKETMMFEPIYKGKCYPELSSPEKIVCLANEFYRHSHQQWSPRDISFLKSIIVQIGHQPTEKIALKEVYQTYQQDNGLLHQLFLGIDESPQLHKSTEMTPTLMAFNKLKSFETEEAHIVDTIEKFAPDTSRNKASLTLTTNFIANQCSRDLNQKITYFDAVMNLVEDLTFYKHLNVDELIEYEIENKEKNQYAQQYTDTIEYLQKELKKHVPKKEKHSLQGSQLIFKNSRGEQIKTPSSFVVKNLETKGRNKTEKDIIFQVKYSSNDSGGRRFQGTVHLPFSGIILDSQIGVGDIKELITGYPKLISTEVLLIVEKTTVEVDYDKFMSSIDGLTNENENSKPLKQMNDMFKPKVKLDVSTDTTDAAAKKPSILAAAISAKISHQ